jgi:hypothetical protein
VEQAHTVLSSLQAVAADDRYAVMRNAASRNLAMSLINLPAAERILRGNATLREDLYDLSMDTPGAPMTGLEILNALELLYNHPDSEKAVYARGVFSGFPSASAAVYAAVDPYDRNSLRPVEIGIVENIISGHGLERYGKPIFTAQPTPSRERTATVQDVWNTLSATPLIAGYGIDYRAVEGVQPDDILHCQALMEIDQYLGLSEYLASIGRHS